MARLIKTIGGIGFLVFISGFLRLVYQTIKLLVSGRWDSLTILEFIGIYFSNTNFYKWLINKDPWTCFKVII